jgi:hypothetical protein
MMCPFLEEIVMVYCRAYPVRKLVPKYAITTESACMCEGYVGCPLFKEIMARLAPSAHEKPQMLKGEGGPVRREALS